MALSEASLNKYKRMILNAKNSLMVNNPFFSSLLMHMKISLDEQCSTAYTDSERICFGPAFLDEISDSEVEFVLLHELLHAVLGHCTRGKELDNETFNIACDIVVNSIILESCNFDTSYITIDKYGEAMHMTPDGSEGYLFSAEEVYRMLLREGHGTDRKSSFTDDHSKWTPGKNASEESCIWRGRIKDAVVEATVFRRQGRQKNLPKFARDYCKKKRRETIDWKKNLHNFMENNLFDYSFSPPDRRFCDGEFFLPDFNSFDLKSSARRILFMVDTSGSVGSELLSEILSEIENAINAFNGNLEGWLGFFDSEVVPPKHFSSKEEFESIAPGGGGGTSFECVFDYVNETMKDEPPWKIVIMTDGWANFPDESAANSIPVLWIISDKSRTPPWGAYTVFEF